MSVRFGIVVFPGTNCDLDTKAALEASGVESHFVWHTATRLDGFECVILPGGFAHGDYLRTGAIAAFSPIIPALRRHIDAGGLVIGICNGFQVLLEMGVLPGAMMRNRSLRFICRFVHVLVEQADTPFTMNCTPGQVLRMPISHFEGNYYIDEAGLKSLIDNRQVVLRYCDAEGKCTPESNPNGAAFNIAGICNADRNVFGLMPHPERASDSLLGSVDGKLIFESIAESVSGRSIGQAG
ncbi:MAG: phosphoribosylformylglycinamidine synthase I [Candidatus Coatesbacteria bacterium]|nr:MAG: phosphoribosylformylglycinamidine synthase I [Candidatus Coatesbacteria bacterium]